jgi:hypothetical protein
MTSTSSAGNEQAFSLTVRSVCVTFLCSSARAATAYFSQMVKCRRRHGRRGQESRWRGVAMAGGEQQDSVAAERHTAQVAMANSKWHWQTALADGAGKRHAKSANGRRERQVAVVIEQERPRGLGGERREESAPTRNGGLWIIRTWSISLSHLEWKPVVLKWQEH